MSRSAVSVFFLLLFTSLLAPAEDVRVRILPDVSEVKFQAQELVIVDWNVLPERLTSELTTYRLGREWIQNHWYWRIEKVSASPDSASFYFSAQRLKLRATRIKYEDSEFNGEWILTSHDSKNFDVIVNLDLDSYLMGVVPHEMPPSWPIEALKAQAITARSYALAIMDERKDEDYDLENSVMDQVYRPFLKESPFYEKIKSIIQETKDYSLSYGKNGQILKAFYHSQCGGRTTTPTSVWGSGVDTGVAFDRSCSLARSQWRFRIKKESLLEKVKGYLRESLSDLVAVKPVSKDKDRVKMVQLASNEGATRISANDLRRLIGFGDLKSARFAVKRIGDFYEFQGSGMGHGVGLCQWGAKAMALQGSTYQDILKHYYPKATLQGRHHSQSEEQDSAEN